MSLQELDRLLAQFRLTIEQDGLNGALRFLNARTSYRYTAIYRLDGLMMRNIYLYDRRGEDATNLSEVPLATAFASL